MFILEFKHSLIFFGFKGTVTTDVECTTNNEDIFILHNTKDAEILSADIMPTFGKYYVLFRENMFVLYIHYILYFIT